MSSLRRRILRLNQIARDRLTYVADAHETARIERELLSAAPLRLPLESKSVLFTDEGVETPFLEAEEIDLELTLPAYKIGWDLIPASYRLEISLEGAGTLTARRPDGSLLFKNRRLERRAVLDFSDGQIRLEASSPITRIRLARFTTRAEGSILLGPFRASGIVRAKIVGHGDFRVELAHDEDVPYRIERTALVSDDRYAGTWSVYGSEQKPGLSYSIARQFDPALPAPAFQRELACGKIYQEPEATTGDYYDDVPADFWRGVGNWAAPGEIDEPSFSTERGFWAYLWGTASGDQLLEAFDASTGTPAQLATVASRTGFYLIKAFAATEEELEVVVNGTIAAAGEPLRLSSDPVLPAHNTNTYLTRTPTGVLVPKDDLVRLPYELRPDRFLVKITGRGILRAVEFTVRHNTHRPDGVYEETIYREELSNYKDPDASWPRQRRQRRSNAGLSLEL